MLSINWQRKVFLLSAVIFLLVSLFTPRLESKTEILITGALILFIGVPHGALDLLYLRKVLGVHRPVNIAISILAYLAISALIVGLWLWSPLLFLVGFLLASGLHFSGDPDNGVSPLTRVTVGTGVIVLPSLFHSKELEHLYSLLTNQAVAEKVVSLSFPLACAVIGIGTISLGIEVVTRNFKAATELLIVGMLSTIAPPLLAFTIYFCLMHSARHIVRTSELILVPKRAFVLECVLPMVGVFISGAIAWNFKNSLSIDAKVIQILFVLLAALTAPHMVIVEPIRFRGWVNPLSTKNIQ